MSGEDFITLGGGKPKKKGGVHNSRETGGLEASSIDLIDHATSTQ